MQLAGNGVQTMRGGGPLLIRTALVFGQRDIVAGYGPRGLFFFFRFVLFCFVCRRHRDSNSRRLEFRHVKLDRPIADPPEPFSENSATSRVQIQATKLRIKNTG